MAARRDEKGTPRREDEAIEQGLESRDACRNAQGAKSLSAQIIL
jgi:hypothetical protein